MSKVKFRSMTIMALAALLALVFAFAVGTLAAPARRTALAVSYSPDAVFSRSTAGDVSASEEDADGNSYIAFSIRDGGRVEYRRDLALKWYEADEGATSLLANPGKACYFNFSFRFPTIGFETFTITFESNEENISKDGKSTNAIVFTAGAVDTATVALRNSSYEEGTDDSVAGTISAGSLLTLRMSEVGCDIGEFAVFLHNGTEELSLGKFTNIGSYFMEYRSQASSTPNLPMSFSAKLPAGEEDAEEAASQTMLAISLNSQSFLLDENGSVVDDCAPVLVLNEKVYAFTLGQRFSLSYEVIDVCDNSVTPSRSYYMLKTDGDGNYLKPSETTDDDYKTLTTSTYFMPTSDTGSETEHVSIRFRMTDDSGNEGNAYLTWYAAEEAGIVETLGNAGADTFDYIVVNRDKNGPVYTGVTVNDEYTEDEKKGDPNLVDAEAEEARAAYQAALDEAAANASAGSGAEIYLPSLRGLISSAYADYRNLTFSIYYYEPGQASGATASSESSLSYNNLRIEIDKAGDYRFRVMAEDGSGNGIMLKNEDGELVQVTSSNIWDLVGVPEFTFTVGYSGATIEDPGEQSVGYRGSTYSIESFEIVSLGHEADYSLYYLDSDLLDGPQAPNDYSDFVANAAEYFETYREALREIQVYNDEITEDDSRWERTDNAYEWDPDSSLSFCPQRSGYYVVQLILTDTTNEGETKTSYQVIDIRNPIDSPPAHSDWLENNVTSVVLFAVAGVLALALVVLFIVKPSDKGVDEIDLEKLKGRKKQK